MSGFYVKEKRFEQDIEEYPITEGAYERGNPQKLYADCLIKIYQYGGKVL